ncbi:MAG: hypothetical protein OCD76_17690 [Reichenbachiella sp.]
MSELKKSANELRASVLRLNTKVYELDGHEWLDRLPEKWSKKEILGHLIDSALNNLKRFTEIHFSAKPYIVISYNQMELVRANDYQSEELEQLVLLFTSLNMRIAKVMEIQSVEQLNAAVFADGANYDLRFLMEDYVVHLNYHLDQILVGK